MIYNECFDKPEMFDAIMAPAPGVDLHYPGAPPLLSRAQEAHLFRQMNFLLYRGETDAALAIRNYIVRANVRLVYKMARKAYNYVAGAGGRWYETEQVDRNVLEDLEGDGFLWLANAADHFDFALGNKFSTYACTALRKNFMRSVPLLNRTTMTHVNNQPDWFDAADSGDSEAAEALRDEQRKSEVAELFRKLLPREQEILRMRFFDDLTLEQVGEHLGLTKERVRQIQVRAMKKLRGE